MKIPTHFQKCGKIISDQGAGCVFVRAIIATLPTIAYFVSRRGSRLQSRALVGCEIA